MSIGSYFWNAYYSAATCLSDATTAMKNIRKEDVTAAANKVKETAVKAKEATVSVIQNTAHNCGTAFQIFIPQSAAPLEREEKQPAGETAEDLPIVEQMGESETEESVGETWQEVVIGAAEQEATPAPLAASDPWVPIVRLPAAPPPKYITDHQDNLLGPRKMRPVPSIQEAEERLEATRRRSAQKSSKPNQQVRFANEVPK